MEEKQNQNFFGEYNHIYFLEEKGIAAILDRAHRKKPILFQEEELEDLLVPPREKPETILYFGVSDMFDEGKEIHILGRTFTLKGPTHRFSTTQFGRSLEYHIVDTGGNCISVLLTVELPKHVRYTCHWEPVQCQENEFLLHEKIKVTVITDLNWQFRDGTFAVESGSEESKVYFLVESYIPESPVKKIALFVAVGREREALEVRALCGNGFMPCFVIKSEELFTKQAKLLASFFSNSLCIGIGLDLKRLLPGADTLSVENPDFENEISYYLKGNLPAPTLVAPLKKEAYGPALFLALQNNARLKFCDDESQTLKMFDCNDKLIKNWRLDDLLNVPLNSHPHTPPNPSNSELVICENSLEDLLVAQAVGYWFVRPCRIIFISPIEETFSANEQKSASASMHELVSIMARCIPEEIRRPDAQIITIFTRSIPLHLVQFDQDHFWKDKYALAHLPGQLASYLIPRYFVDQLEEVPPVPFSLIFDALGYVTNTEGKLVSDQLVQALSHPILLSQPSALGEVLREILQRLDIDLLLLITHGGGDAIADGHQNLVTSSDISNWKFRGSPLIFNNSCTSWETTGAAFLMAGARGFIGSLWPIQNNIAAEIAGKVGMEIQNKGDLSIPLLLAQSFQEIAQRSPEARVTLAAYIYVGLPETYLLIKPLISNNEKVSLLSNAFNHLYNMLSQIASDGRPDLAAIIHTSIRNPIRQRFLDLVVPGEIPINIPMMSHVSVLDVDFMMSVADFEFGRMLLEKLPPEQQLSVISKMNDFLETAIYELSTWDDRHDQHLNRTKQEREELSKRSGFNMGAMGELGFLKLASSLVLTHILPFIWQLFELKQKDLADNWFSLSKKLVTTPSDLSADGSVSDAALLNRLKVGIVQTYRSMDVKTGEWSETNLDLMGNSVNKSDLANRFGITYLKMEDYQNAEQFFRLARDLAEPGSRHYANAESNLSNALRNLGRLGETFDGYLTAMNKQEELKDFQNALITAANLVRMAVKLHKLLDEHAIMKMITWVDFIDSPGQKALRACDLFGALSKYYLSYGKPEKARTSNKSILSYVLTPYHNTQLIKNLNEMAEWYYDNHEYPQAGREAEHNADLLSNINMSEESILTLLIACDCFINAYDQKRSKKFLGDFIRCSQKMGLLFSREPGLQNRIWPKVESTWEQTSSLWEQFEEHREYQLALQTYICVKVWFPEKAEARWDLFESTSHPMNKAAMDILAQKGLVRRTANIVIDQRKSVSVETTTVRKSTNELGIPDTIYGYLPLYPDSSASITSGNGVIVGGVAAYPLKAGNRVTVKEQGLSNLKTDGRGTFLYQEIWGSRKIIYDLYILLPPNCIPIDLEVENISGEAPTPRIRFSNEGCHITFSADEMDQARGSTWLGDVHLLFRDVPGKVNPFADPDAPFVKEMDFHLYQALLKMLSR